MGVDDIDRRSFCPYILHRLGLPEDADSRDMLEEQLRVVVGRRPARALLPTQSSTSKSNSSVHVLSTRNESTGVIIPS